MNASSPNLRVQTNINPSFSSAYKLNRDALLAPGSNLQANRGRETGNSAYGNVQRDVIYQSYKEEIENEKKEIARKLVLLDQEKQPLIKDLSKVEDEFGAVGSGIVSEKDFETEKKKPSKALERFKKAAKKVSKMKAISRQFEFGVLNAGIIAPQNNQEEVRLAIKKGEAVEQKRKAVIQKQKFKVDNNQKVINKTEELRKKGYQTLSSDTILGVEKYMLLNEKRFSPKCMIDSLVIDKKLPHYLHTKEHLFEAIKVPKKGEPGYIEHQLDIKKKKFFAQKKDQL